MMKNLARHLMLALALGVSFAGTAYAAAGTTPALDEFRRQIVAGDGKAALAALERVAPAQRTEKEASLRECLSLRLAGATPASVPPGLANKPGAMRILQAYRNYWRASLAVEVSQPAAQAALLAELNAVLPADDPAAWNRTSMDEAARQARRYLEGLGLHAVTGVTRPYYELILWTEQSTQEYRVDLTDRVVTVPVTFMDGFASRGWLHYATCEWFGAGGWTADGHLYAIRSNYDLASENFRVSYLGHEGRHFADNQAFPKLDQAELEYRAKLTELVLSRETTRQLFDKFLRTGRAGRAAPHPHAEYWLARNMQEQLFPGSATAAQEQPWNTVTDEQLRQAAAMLLARSTAQATAAGKDVTRLLPD